jgi:hypothetical protein
LKNEKKRASKKKDSLKKGVEEDGDRYEEILRTAPELPSHIVHMRSVWKRKKHGRPSHKRKR